MDTLSHALWGYAVLRWRGPRSARWGLLFGALPDLVFGAARITGVLLTEGWEGLKNPSENNPAIWSKDGPPLPPELLAAYNNYYVYTHSLIIVGLIALAWFALRRKPPWPLLATFVHILMDIPTHERYLTPFLFPLSDLQFVGIGWSRPPILIANWGGLLVAYALLFWRYWRPGRPPREGPWPEDSTKPQAGRGD